MGSGKTTIGREVAGRLGRDFLDSDDQVEARTGRSVREIFETEGEAAFRAFEASALAVALARPEPAVIAGAGGVVLDAATRRRLQEAGTVVWLRADPAVLATRVGSSDHRPLLGDDPLAVLIRLDGERRALYQEVADHVVDVGQRPSSAVVDDVLAVVA